MTATFHVGDAVTVMNTLPEKSVDLILTSPPFLALRSYLPSDHPDKALEGGSQATPGAYIDWLLDVVEACARVLAPHGSLCFELGDTYAGGNSEDKRDVEGGIHEDWRPNAYGSATITRGGGGDVTKAGKAWPLAKSLSLIPESFRFAMVYGRNPHTGRQTEPWRLRNVIRWVRPNPSVGALGDKFRPATSELMVFCKAKDRFFDLDAVREPGASFDRPEVFNGFSEKDRGRQDEYGDKVRLKEHIAELKQHPAGAPPLDWWNIPPGGYPGAHYAVWPPELLVKPIKAMCPEKVCRRCGEASRRVVEGDRVVDFDKVSPSEQALERNIYGQGRNKRGTSWGSRTTGVGTTYTTLGFTDCGHDDYRPGLVLDLFAGSGTTLAVATGHGRDAIGIDLDERNYELALDRVGPLILSKGDGAAPRP